VLQSKLSDHSRLQTALVCIHSYSYQALPNCHSEQSERMRKRVRVSSSIYMGVVVGVLFTYSIINCLGASNTFDI